MEGGTGKLTLVGSASVPKLQERREFSSCSFSFAATSSASRASSSWTLPFRVWTAMRSVARNCCVSCLPIRLTLVQIITNGIPCFKTAISAWALVSLSSRSRMVV